MLGGGNVWITLLLVFGDVLPKLGIVTKMFAAKKGKL